MFQAVWNGAVLAETEQTVKVEGNHYFPPQALRREYFSDSQTTTACPWKGTASYYDITVDGQVNRDAAWYYPQPSPAAAQIAGHVAFWHGVKVVRVAGTGDPAASRGGVAARRGGRAAAEHVRRLIRAPGAIGCQHAWRRAGSGITRS